MGLCGIVVRGSVNLISITVNRDLKPNQLFLLIPFSLYFECKLAINNDEEAE